MHKLYFDSARDQNIYNSLWGLKEQREDRYQEDNHVVDAQDDLLNNENRHLIRDYTMRDLFLWSILMNRIDMAKVFLSHMKYRVCAALIATKILKEYYGKATYGELKDSYLGNANYFEKYAIECINKCEKNDADQACPLVLQRIELYGNVTCLQV
jgi:hypothetical protein